MEKMLLDQSKSGLHGVMKCSNRFVRLMIVDAWCDSFEHRASSCVLCSGGSKQR